jgi:hypothetical protein
VADETEVVYGLEQAVYVPAQPALKNARLYTALIAAQVDMLPLYKTSLNPHFKSKYVDLSGVVDAVADSLQKNGLALIQMVQLVGVDNKPVLVSRLAHESGEYIESEYPLITKDNSDPQKLGAAITYARRYSMMAMLGIAPEDDDGNTASGRSSSAAPAKSAAAKPKAAPANGGPSDAQKRLVSKLVESKLGATGPDEFLEAVRKILKKPKMTLADMAMRDASTIIEALKEAPDFRPAKDDEPGY